MGSSFDMAAAALHIRKQQAEPVEDNPWLSIGTDEIGPEVSIQIGEKSYEFLIDTGSPS